MKRLVAVAFMLLIVAAALFEVARGQLVRAADERVETRSSHAEFTLRSDFPAEPNRHLREQVLERLKAKVELMSDEELQKALEETNKDIRAKEAAKQLNECIESMRNIVEKYEGTSAATTSKRLLDALDPKTEI
jgi:hypothetical protein